MYRQEKKVDDYGVLQRHFYFYYFPAWAAKNYPNKQSHEDFLIRNWILMFKELDKYPPITQNFVMDVFQKLLLGPRFISSMIESSPLAVAIIPPSKPNTTSSLHRFVDFVCKGNHNMRNYKNLIRKKKETLKGPKKKFLEIVESLEVTASPDVDNILVIDDVSTTGASLAAANKLLRDAGYKGKIISLSFARTMKSLSDKKANTIPLPDIFSLNPSKDSFIYSKKLDEIAKLIKEHYRR